MNLFDSRLRGAINVDDFLFRLNFRDEDIRSMREERAKLIPYARVMEEGFVAPSNVRIWGVDISHWNGIVDLSKAKAAGCSFVILKGCDGSIPTRNFEQNKTNAKQNGLPWGVYEWLYRAVNVSISTQAVAWWNQVKGDYPPLGVKVDFEWTKYNGAQSNPNSSDLQNALDKFFSLSGIDAGIYSAKGYTDQYLTHDLKWNRYKWWIANYGVTTPLMPYGVTAWQFWQFTDNLDGAQLGINTLEGDGNYYFGTREQFNQEFRLLPTSTLNEDTPLKVRRFGSDCYLLLVDPRKYRSHVTDTHGILERTSDAARRLGARFAINGDGWWTADNTPLSISVSDGRKYQDTQYDLRPLLNISSGGIPWIGWKDFPPLYNAVSGTRQLVIDGQFNPAITDAARNPRTAMGIDTQGRLILLVVEGRSETDSGVTLSELAQILIEFGSVSALEMDGGGSSSLVADGVLLNTPSDPTGERAVVNHLVFFGGPMTDYLKIIGTDGNNHRVRMNHDVRSSAFADRNITNTVWAKAGAGVEDTFTFPGDVPDLSIPGGFAAKGGDVWHKVFEVDGVSVLGWTAEIHLGIRQGISITPVGSTTPPAPALPDLPIHMEIGDDLTYIKQTVDLILKPKQ